LHSQYGAHGHWPDDCAGLRLKPYKSSGIKKSPPSPSGYVGQISEGVPPTRKKLPVQADIPELLVETAYQLGKPAQQQATADLTMIAFYYLLRAGEYTIKGSRNSTKQTVQFKYEDVSFFKKNTRGQL
jgi:hypothetical protein